MNLVLYWPGTQFGFGDTDVVARWYDATSSPVSDVFVVASGGSDGARMLLRSLIGGGATFQLDGNWIASFDSGIVGVQPPPQFLADHPGWDFEIVRSRRASSAPLGCTKTWWSGLLAGQ